MYTSGSDGGSEQRKLLASANLPGALSGFRAGGGGAAADHARSAASAAAAAQHRRAGPQPAPPSRKDRREQRVQELFRHAVSSRGGATVW